MPLNLVTMMPGETQADIKAAVPLMLNDISSVQHNTLATRDIERYIKSW